MGGREGGKEGRREGGKEGGRERREGGREGGRKEGGRPGGREGGERGAGAHQPTHNSPLHGNRYLLRLLLPGNQHVPLSASPWTQGSDISPSSSATDHPLVSSLRGRERVMLLHIHIHVHCIYI